MQDLGGSGGGGDPECVSHLAAPLQLRVPRRQQGVVELGQLLAEVQLTLREILPHVYQLALERR